jgi:hypothetical protein
VRAQGPDMARADHFKAAQEDRDSTASTLSMLQAELQHASPSQKADIVAQINQYAEALVYKQKVLDDADKALEVCRNKWKWIWSPDATAAQD